MRRLVKPLVFLACLTPMALAGWDLAMGNIRGEWVKEITHRTGFWGLVLLTCTLAVTPVRRLTHWNAIQPYRRMLGLFAFFYICVHFLVIYVVLDKQLPFDPAFAWDEIVKDVAKRPYITVGFAGFLLMIPLALTSTKGWIRRLGKRWVSLHGLVYAVALAGVVHFAWSVKADRFRADVIGATLIVLLGLRLAPRRWFERRRVSARPGEAARTAPELSAAG